MTKEFWITTARPTEAHRRSNGLHTSSEARRRIRPHYLRRWHADQGAGLNVGDRQNAKACYYAAGKNKVQDHHQAV
ncbi:MAG: hypothetical protein U0559_00325 [Anaerolineae bacterium]